MPYLAEGWKRFSFLLTPEELFKVLESYHLVIEMLMFRWIIGLIG